MTLLANEDHGTSETLWDFHAEVTRTTEAPARVAVDTFVYKHRASPPECKPFLGESCISSPLAQRTSCAAPDSSLASIPRGGGRWPRDWVSGPAMPRADGVSRQRSAGGITVIGCANRTCSPRSTGR